MLNSVLWVVQVLLALVFSYTGGKNLLQSNDHIQALPWARGLAVSAVRGIGILEVLGAVGVLVPLLSGILPWLTPLAAGGLALLMVGAASINVRLKLYPLVVANLVLLLLAVCVAYGRIVFRVV